MSMMTKTKSHSAQHITEKLADCKEQLTAARSAMPAVQRAAAQAFLEGESVGYRTDGAAEARAKVARMEELIEGLHQLRALSEYRENTDRIAQLQSKSTTVARRLPELEAKFKELNRHPVWDTESQRIGAHSAMMEARDALSQNDAQIENLQRRCVELKQKHPDAFAAEV